MDEVIRCMLFITSAFKHRCSFVPTNSLHRQSCTKCLPLNLISFCVMSTKFQFSGKIFIELCYRIVCKHIRSSKESETCSRGVFITFNNFFSCSACGILYYFNLILSGYSSIIISSCSTV